MCDSFNTKDSNVTQSHACPFRMIGKMNNEIFEVHDVETLKDCTKKDTHALNEQVACVGKLCACWIVTKAKKTTSGDSFETFGRCGLPSPLASVTTGHL